MAVAVTRVEERQTCGRPLNYVYIRVSLEIITAILTVVRRSVTSIVANSLPESCSFGLAVLARC
jgi:hypothetical protein